MKKIVSSALFLSLGIPAIAQTVGTTSPVGYAVDEKLPGGYHVFTTAAVGHLTEHLHPGMNIIGLRLHESEIASGTLGALGTDFAELSGLQPEKDGTVKLALAEGNTYILEITSGAKAGVIQEITQWQGLRLKLADDLAKAGVKTGDKFSIRKAATLNSVFNPRTTELKKGDIRDEVDMVLIPQGTFLDKYRHCFILSAPDVPATWMDAETLEPVGDLPLVYPDGLMVRISGTRSMDMAFSGQVKPGPTRSVVKTGINIVATPYPVKDQLQDLGLENDLAKSDNPDEADHVLVSDPYGFGDCKSYYLDKDGKWNNGDGEPVTGKIPVGSAILVERKGPDAMFCLGD